MGMKLAFFLDIWNIFDAVTATWTAVTKSSGDLHRIDLKQPNSHGNGASMSIYEHLPV
jgi:hypothetical protein